MKGKAVPLHLLCISRTADARRWEPGSPIRSEGNGHDARWIAEGPLAAAVVPPLPRSTGPLAHAGLLEAIFRQGDLLPVRFGVVLDDEEAVRDLLRGRREELLHALDRLRGTAEMGLRIELPDCSPPDPPVPTGSGHLCNSSQGYMAVRRRQYQRQDALTHRAALATEECIQTVKGLYRDWRRLSSEPARTVRLAFLVERRFSEKFAERLDAAKALRADQQHHLVGPWPPYSFV